MYDPTIGRWLSPDPSGFAAGDYNLYRYVRNDPVNAIDPSGLAAAYVQQWHHLLSQHVFTPEKLKKLGLPNLNIDDAHWGYILFAKNHIEKGGVEPQWRFDWRDWVDKRIEKIEKGEAGPVTVEELDAKIKDMMEGKYRKSFYGPDTEGQARADVYKTGQGKTYTNYDVWEIDHPGDPEKYKAALKKQYKQEIKEGLFGQQRMDAEIDRMAEERAEAAKKRLIEKRKEAAARGQATKQANKAAKSAEGGSGQANRATQRELFTERPRTTSPPEGSRTPADKGKTQQFGTMLALLYGGTTVVGLAKGLTHYKQYEPELEAILQRYNAARNLKDEDQIRVALYELNQSIYAYLEKLGNEPNADALLKVVDYYRLLGKEIKVGSLPALNDGTTPARGALTSAYTNLSFSYETTDGEASGKGSMARARVFGRDAQIEVRLVPSDGDARVQKGPKITLMAKGANLPAGVYEISYKVTVGGGPSDADPKHTLLWASGTYPKGEFLFYAPREKVGAAPHQETLRVRFYHKGGPLSMSIATFTTDGFAHTEPASITLSISHAKYSFTRLRDRSNWRPLRSPSR